ncbi:ubiquinone biosynthesis protein COQ3, mitochondrial [Lycorma delicatula]|uniref:ubiquinone biosynthesis protein COQ3, mitochondrial n=1 Tax=Lycorma delicatula TaxID=130591 RepID=UPI003F514FCF
MFACCSYRYLKNVLTVFKRNIQSSFITSNRNSFLKCLNSATRFERVQTIKTHRGSNFSQVTSNLPDPYFPATDENIVNQNVDNADVSRHEAIKDWWNVYGPMEGLHAMNDLRISLIRNGLENTGRLKLCNINNNPEYLKGIKIIEVGCGGGILCEPLARVGAEVTGIDPSQELILIAKDHAAENAATLKSAPLYINTNIEEHSVSNPNLYDVVVVSEVIEHVPNKEMFLESCIKILKPGGSLFITTPNRTRASWFGTVLIAENILKMLPRGVHDWNNFITPTELKHLLAKLGCKTVLMNGMIYNVLSHSWSWTASLTFHYALHAIKLNSE